MLQLVAMLMFTSLSASQRRIHKDGFTIVELLVVIVIIAILAAVTTVAYQGVQNRAVRSSLSNTLSNTVKQLEADKVDRGSYAPSLSSITGSSASNNTGVEFEYTSNGLEYCVTAKLNNVAMHSKSSERTPTNGVCEGHAELVTGPISDPVVHTQTGTFNTRQPPTGGLSVPIKVNYNLQPNDYVFILYNADYYTDIALKKPDGTAIQPLYSKSMGPSGYSRHIAFGTSGLSGEATISAVACWSPSCSYDGPTVEAGYIVYVIKGLGGAPKVTATSTAYGVQPPYNSVFAPDAQPLPARKLAIYSYVYYGNRTPQFQDASEPTLTWSVDATSSDTATDQVAARHAYTTSSTNVKFNMIIPSSGAAYSGAVLFTIQ